MRSLFAVVYSNDPTKIVKETGAPFDAETFAEAEQEVSDTYGAQIFNWAKVVPLTPKLEEQYKELKAT